MNFHVLTLFPDMIIDGLNTSITGRAIKNGCLSVEAVNIRDYANNKHMKVDDYPYGGGAGLVMQAAPVCAAYDSLVQKIGKKPRVVYMTPDIHLTRKWHRILPKKTIWLFYADIMRA